MFKYQGSSYIDKYREFLGLDTRFIALNAKVLAVVLAIHSAILASLIALLPAEPSTLHFFGVFVFALPWVLGVVVQLMYVGMTGHFQLHPRYYLNSFLCLVTLKVILKPVAWYLREKAISEAEKRHQAFRRCANKS